METNLQIPSSVTVRNARDIQQQFLAKLTDEGSTELDISDVTEADLSFVQLIHALRAAAAEAGQQVRLRAPAPAPVAALLKRAGFLAAPTADDLEFWFHGERAQ